MNINQFRRHLYSLTEATTIRDKTDKQGINGAHGYLSVKNSEFKDRAIWLPDKTDKAFWSASELKKVYRFYVNDDPRNSTGGTGLIKVDLEANTVQILDQDKYLAANERLTPSVWGRKYKIDYVTIFDKAVLAHQ